MVAQSETLINALAKGYNPAEQQNLLADIEYKKMRGQAFRNELMFANSPEALAQKREDVDWTQQQRERVKGGWAQEDEVTQRAKVISGFSISADIFDQDTDMETHNSMVDQYQGSPELQKIIPKTAWNTKKFTDPGEYEKERAIEARRVKQFKALLPKKTEKPTLIPKGTIGTMGPGGKIEPLPPGLPTEEEKGESDIGKMAHDIYGKSYQKLNPEEKKDVDERVKMGGVKERKYPQTKAETEEHERFKAGLKPEKPGRLGEEEFYERLTAKETIKHLPKLKSDAKLQKSAIETIDKALALTEKGVTGKGGQLKAVLAGYAEMAGIETEALSDAQAFQALTRVIIGPMRLDIVGSGQISDYENRLMKEVSGGGGAAKKAAVELLRHWRKRAISKVEDYNTTIEGVSSISPGINKVYKPIEVPGGSKSKGKTFKEGNNTWNDIPPEKEARFKELHPNAVEVK